MTPLDYEFLRKFLKERSGLDLSADKQYLVESRLTPIARKAGLPGIGELVQKMKGGCTGTMSRVVEAMTTNETFFFRDKVPFDHLRDTILPELLRARGERAIDMLVLSHRDSDHTGGAAAVLAQQPQAMLTGSIAWDEALRALGPAAPCLAGQRWHWDGVDFEVLHPLPGAADAAPGLRAVRPNSLSCVLRIVSSSGTLAT